VLAGGGENDSFESGLGLAGLAGQFLIDDFEGRTADAGGVRRESDRRGWILQLEALDGLASLRANAGVGRAQWEDFGRDELPGFGARMGRVDPVVGAVDLLDVADQGERARIFGLAEVEAEDRLEK